MRFRTLKGGRGASVRWRFSGATLAARRVEFTFSCARASAPCQRVLGSPLTEPQAGWEGAEPVAARGLGSLHRLPSPPGHPGKVYRWGPSPRAQANPAFQAAVEAGTIVGASARPPTADDLRSMPSPERSPAACEKLPRAGTSMGDLYFGIL